MINPSEFTVLKLFRDCLRLADYIATRGGNRLVLRGQIKDAFRRNQHETDPLKIDEQKSAAIRGLSNYMFFEAQRLAKDQVEEGKDKFEG